MSFAKIAEARAVKKIVSLINQHAADFEEMDDRGEAYAGHQAMALRAVAAEIEEGEWKNIVLPKPAKKKAKKKK